MSKKQQDKKEKHNYGAAPSASGNPTVNPGKPQEPRKGPAQQEPRQEPRPTQPQEPRHGQPQQKPGGGGGGGGASQPSRQGGQPQQKPQKPQGKQW